MRVVWIVGRQKIQEGSENGENDRDECCLALWDNNWQSICLKHNVRTGSAFSHSVNSSWAPGEAISHCWARISLLSCGGRG